MKNLRVKSSFKKDIKKFKNNDKIKKILNEVIQKLLNEVELDDKFKNHRLINDYKNCFDCHILPDLILIYSITEIDITLIRLFNHSELLKK